MARVQMNRFAAESGRMPPVCICCGSAARQHVRHTFYYQPTWLVLIYIFLPRVLKWYLSSNPATVTVPVCAAHFRRLRWPKYVGYTLAVGLLLFVPALLAASIAQWHNLLGFMGILVLLWCLALWATYVIVSLLTPRAEHYTTSLVTLTAVSPAFSQALQAGGVGAQQGMRPLPGLGGPKTVGGLTQGMLALLIMGVGGLGFLAVCFAIGFGSYYVRKARFRELQQVANNPPPAQNWGPPPIQPPTTFPHTSPTWMPSGAPPANQTPPADLALNPNAVTPGPAIPPPPPAPVTSPTSIPAGSTPPTGADAVTWNEQGQFVFAYLDTNRQPTVTPSGSHPITNNTPLAVGDRVWVLQGGAWHSGIVREVIGVTQAKIHTPPFPETFAEVHSRSALRLAQAPRADVVGNSAAGAPSTSATNSSAGEIIDDPAFGEGTLTISGEAPPPGSSAITTATPLKPGNKVWHLWGNQWYPGEIVSLVGPDTVRIHYFGYPTSSDDEVPRHELRLPRGSRVTQMAPTSAPSSAASSPTANASAPPKDPDVRTWTDATGKFKIEARLLEYTDGKVKLERTDGKVVTLPFEKLSPADQFHLETKSP